MTNTVLLIAVICFLGWQYFDTRRRLKRLSRSRSSPGPIEVPESKSTAPDSADEWPLKRIYEIALQADSFSERLSALSPHRTPGYRVPPEDLEERLRFVNTDGITERCEITGHVLAPNDDGYLDVEASDQAWHYLVEEYEKYVPFKRGVETVIDIGAGNGAFGATMCRRGVSVLNIDAELYHSLQQVAATRGLLTMNWNVRAPLPFVPNSFDAVHSNDVFFYFNPAEICSIFDEWDRIVRPGGFFILTFYQVSGTAEAHADRVNAVDESAKKLEWQILKRETATLESDDQHACYAIFQKPV